MSFILNSNEYTHKRNEHTQLSIKHIKNEFYIELR
ncbi:unnamed protein product [Cuscuta epithymum]|uniref:Uncharacterized protein n=1 Tax=Cuscuta epithymum TaxID=186058 RepID=A0AAV0GDL4_9ASTE|nr:unnamed protein product [Cuscuta epithymum]